MNDNAEIVAAYDGACPPWRDAWGYPLEGRTYNADSMKFKYTGKELDKESLYKYFGARYYDSRIGRWGQVEPLLDKYRQVTPYSYSIDNPLIFLDPKGLFLESATAEKNSKYPKSSIPNSKFKRP